MYSNNIYSKIYNSVFGVFDSNNFVIDENRQSSDVKLLHFPCCEGKLVLINDFIVIEDENAFCFCRNIRITWLFCSCVNQKSQEKDISKHLIAMEVSIVFHLYYGRQQ